jgi:hypothetical protein
MFGLRVGQDAVKPFEKPGITRCCGNSSVSQCLAGVRVISESSEKLYLLLQFRPPHRLHTLCIDLTVRGYGELVAAGDDKAAIGIGGVYRT